MREKIVELTFQVSLEREIQAREALLASSGEASHSQLPNVSPVASDSGARSSCEVGEEIKSQEVQGNCRFCRDTYSISELALHEAECDQQPQRIGDPSK